MIFFPRLSSFTVWQIKLFAFLFQQNKTEMMTLILALASMYKCKRRSHASVRRYFKLNNANKQPAIAGWQRDKGRGDWVLVLWHEKTAIFLKWLLPSAMPLPNHVFFVFSPSLCLYCELICSQRGNLNCNLKAFLNNFDSLKVAH